MSKALLIIDVQNDFCEGGALEVPNSNQIFPFINRLKTQSNYFRKIILTRDWHPMNHVSFASTHNLEPFKMTNINGESHMFWPNHCVADTYGAQFSKNLSVCPTDIIISKGIYVNVDSYSGFYTNADGKQQLLTILKQSNVEQVYVCGLTFDYCVGNTALDSQSNGFKTFVIKEATKSVSPQTELQMEQKLKENNVEIIQIDQINFQ